MLYSPFGPPLTIPYYQLNPFGSVLQICATKTDTFSVFYGIYICVFLNPLQTFVPCVEILFFINQYFPVCKFKSPRGQTVELDISATIHGFPPGSFVQIQNTENILYWLDKRVHGSCVSATAFHTFYFHTTR